MRRSLSSTAVLGSRRSGVAAAALVVLLAVLGASPGSAAAPPRQWEATELTLEPLSGPLFVDGSAYRGRLHLRVDGGRLRVINEVGVEEYVRGIREVPPSWPLEAQRAQAIAARSYALHQADVARKEGRPWDLCDTAACQVYGGIAAEQRGGAAWARAVDSTVSEVLAFRGAPILAMYSSSNGGRTVAASKPYLRSVPDPDDAASPHHRWRVEVPEAAIGAAVQLPEGAQLTGIERDGATVVARWAGPDPEAPETRRPMAVTEFRKRLEATQPPPAGLPRLLPSTAFVMAASSEPGSVVIDGGGWGHGVGMSQHGALGKARRGMDARRILAAYYAGLTPVKAGAGQVPETIRVALEAGAAATDLGGQGAFRVVADGTEVATGTGTQGWNVAVRQGRLLLTAPPGWQPPAPAAPPAQADPFEPPQVAAAAPAAPEPARPPVAISGVPAGTSAPGPWASVALLLLLAVGASVLRLRDRPDPVGFPRG